MCWRTRSVRLEICVWFVLGGITNSCTHSVFITLQTQCPVESRGGCKWTWEYKAQFPSGPGNQDVPSTLRRLLLYANDLWPPFLPWDLQICLHTDWKKSGKTNKEVLHWEWCNWTAGAQSEIKNFYYHVDIKKNPTTTEKHKQNCNLGGGKPFTQREEVFDYVPKHKFSQDFSKNSLFHHAMVFGLGMIWWNAFHSDLWTSCTPQHVLKKKIWKSSVYLQSSC